MTDNQQQELREIILDLKNDIERIAERQNEMNENLKKIKEAIYNPDQGLYARVRDLEQWQQGISKFIWSFGLAITGLIIQAIYSNLF